MSANLLQSSEQPLRLPARLSEPTRAIAAAWRRLGGGARTLVACSGGADSVSLLLALAAAEPAHLMVGHVEHDMRPRDQAAEDRAFVARLANRLALPFVWRPVSLGTGNAEAQARAARYEALAELARRSDCPLVATAHHADDQLENALIALARGGGLVALAGIAETRQLDERVTLIRPALRARGPELRSICKAAGVAWREDATNADTQRLRAALRAVVVPPLLEIAPSAPDHATEIASSAHDAAQAIAEMARTVFGHRDRWPREQLRPLPPAVLASGLKAAYLRSTGGAHGASLSRRTLMQAAGAIRSTATDPKVFSWRGPIELVVTAHEVAFRKGSTDAPPDHEPLEACDEP